jgi:CheY-like chemotaxis protein
MLKKAGYDVSFFADPRSALEEASTNGQSYDLVITDYSMPGLNGIEFVEKMKEQGVTCPVILSSGFKHDNSGANLIDLHLNKPFSKKELLHAVESFCNQ